MDVRGVMAIVFEIPLFFGPPCMYLADVLMWYCDMLLLQIVHAAKSVTQFLGDLDPEIAGPRLPPIIL